MKKIISLIALSLVTMSLFAQFSYSLDLFSFQPLHKEYLADKNSGNLQFNYIYNFSGFPDHIYQDTTVSQTPDPVYYPLTSQLDLAPFMGQFKLGENMSFLRSTFSFDNFLSPITFDLSFQPVLNLVFEGAMADMIGYDGVFFYGATFSIGDFFSARLGAHHYCNHYGDSILKRIDEAQWNSFLVTYKYVRMDAMALGVSITPVNDLRLYFEYNWVPNNIESLRPVIFRPSWIDISETTYSPDYKARIINFGLEFSHTFIPSLGKTTLAYDCHLFEDGKIVYKDEDGNYLMDKELIHYDPNEPWRCKHSFVINQEFAPTMSLEVGYIYGGSPLNYLYYYEDASWIYVGIKFNPENTISLF